MRLTAIIILVIISSCRNQSPPTTATEEKVVYGETIVPEVKTDKVDSGTTRLVVLFYSIAEGAEHTLVNELLDSLGSYSLKLGKNIDFMKTSWGREGETDICFPLNELTASEQTEFIIWARDLLKKGKWVNIYENYPCPVRPKR